MEIDRLTDDKEFLFAFQFTGDKARKAQQRLRKNIFDVEAWNNCLEEVQYRTIQEVRPIYDTLVLNFPTCGRYWKFYIEHEMRQKNYESTEKLFQRCLTKVLHIDLWKTYLGYIKETKCTLPSFREKMVQAFEFAVDKVGLDTQSFQIWNEYIKFLSDVPAATSFAESQRIIALRKIYQRAVSIPMVNVEQLWRDYTAFETATNANLAKKIIDDKSREYMNARRVAKEHEVATKGINRNQPAVPFVSLSSAGASSSAEQLRQLRLWKRYINWEKANPLQTEDQLALARRVMYAYEQCLLCLGYYPHVWLEAVAYLQESSRTLTDKGEVAMSQLFADEAANLYERAVTGLMHDNMLVHFGYADFEESRNNAAKVHQMYKKLLGEPSVDPTLTYVQYMRFARRAEGIKAARQVFKQAREDHRSNYHVYIAAANMEYFCTKDSAVAFKIFELGLKRYGSNPDFVIAYVDYMSHLNEDNNTRVLFERILSSGQLPSEKSLEVWNAFLSFESEVGDLASILKVEKRRLQATLKPGSESWEDTALMIDRYKYADLYPCTPSQMEAIGYMDFSRRISGGGGGGRSVAGTEAISSAPRSSTTAAPSTLGAVASGMVMASAYRFSMPDTSQMFPFKPKALAPPGSHPVPGGVFPLPPAAARLMQMLPPPTYFHGPFVDVERFVEIFRTATLPDEAEIQASVGWPQGRLDRGTSATVDAMLHNVTAPTILPQQTTQRRRTRIAPGTAGDHDQLMQQFSDDDSSSLPAIPVSFQSAQPNQQMSQQPSPMQQQSTTNNQQQVSFPAGGDIYRMRQLKKARTELQTSGTTPTL